MGGGLLAQRELSTPIYRTRNWSNEALVSWDEKERLKRALQRGKKEENICWV